MRHEKADSTASQNRFQLGLFGETRSGKTVYLTTIAWLAAHGQLSEGVRGLRAADGRSSGYLAERLAMLEAGQWPKGNLDSHPISLLIDLGRRTIELSTNDFKGGDFTAAFCSDDPQDHERAEQFIREMFAGRSAYIFLVDAGDVRDAAEQRGNVAAQLGAVKQASAVEATLEALRKRAGGVSLFHPPVAVVFTKSDQHPQALADPAAYAKQHLRPTWNYLQQHAPGRHKFFAVSCTGEMPADQIGPPVPLRPSPGFLSPIVWCAHVHRRRTRSIGRVLFLLTVVVLGLGFGWLWFENRRAVALLRSELSQINAEQLAQRFQQARDWQSSWRFLPTQRLVSVAALPAELVQEADHRLEASLSNRRDGKGHLRTAEDAGTAEQEVHRLEQDYAGTEPVQRWTTWLSAERRILGHRIVEQLEQLAEGGNERAFDDLAKQYRTVAATELDSRVQRARKLLDERVVADRVRSLWRMVDTDPADVDGIRSQCTLAEELSTRRTTRDKDREFVALVRKIYDDLKKNGLQATLRLEVNAATAERLKWTVRLDGVQKLSQAEYADPLPLRDKRQQHTLGRVTVDLLSSKRLSCDLSIRRGVLSSDDVIRKTWDLTELFPDAAKGIKLVAPADGKKLELVAVDENQRIANHFQAVKQLEGLGDELFRSAR